MTCSDWSSTYHPIWLLPFASHVRCSICRIVIAFPSCRKFPICDSGLRQGIFTGYSPTPVSCAGRVAYFTSYLCAIVLMAGYAGNYISFLSAGRPLVMPFTSLRGMLEDGSYRLGAIARSAQVNFFDVRGFRRTLFFNSSYFESHFFYVRGVLNIGPLWFILFPPELKLQSRGRCFQNIPQFQEHLVTVLQAIAKASPSIAFSNAKKRCTGCMNSEREY